MTEQDQHDQPGAADSAPEAAARAESSANQTESKKPGAKKLVFRALKIAFTAAMLYVIFGKVLDRDGADDLRTRIANLDMRWVMAAVGMQLTAIAFATVRWQRLLVGQGIHAPWRFLGSSIMIARFWGAFTPGGFTGFGGWRIFDIAERTDKTARAAAVIVARATLAASIGPGSRALSSSSSTRARRPSRSPTSPTTRPDSLCCCGASRSRRRR